MKRSENIADGLMSGLLILIFAMLLIGFIRQENRRHVVVVPATEAGIDVDSLSYYMIMDWYEDNLGRSVTMSELESDWQETINAYGLDPEMPIDFGLMLELMLAPAPGREGQ